MDESHCPAAAAIPVALTIAGSDCSGGAGAQADLKTFSALGVYGASVFTALTAQNTRTVSAVWAVPADFVRAQLDAVLDDLAVAAIKLGLQKKLYLGNIDSSRDWGHARDYVEGMWRILQQPAGDDYVLATGETQTVRLFVELAFKEIGRPIEWKGQGVDEKGLDAKTGEVLVEIDPAYFRPTEVDFLLGDPTKAQTKLGWKHKTTFPQLVQEMVASDLKIVERERHRNDRSG